MSDDELDVEPLVYLNRKGRPFHAKKVCLEDETEIEKLCEMLTENIKNRERNAKVTVKEVQDEVKKQ